MQRTRIRPWSRLEMRAALLSVALAAAAAMLAGIGLQPRLALADTKLSLTQTVQGTPMVGQDLTFTVTMTNIASTPVFEGIDDNAPSVGVTFVSLKSTGISCGGTHGNAEIICQPATIASGASVSFALTVRPTQEGAITNSALGDPSFLFNTQVTEQVAPAPTDVQVTGSASTGSPTVGSSYSYTFQVKDNGPWQVDAVAFSDPLPAQVQFVGVNASNGSACTEAAGTVSCGLGSLAVGGQVNVVVTVLAPTAPSTFTNTATVSENVSDTQPANNSVGVTVQVK